MKHLFQFDSEIFLQKEKVPSKSPHIFIVDVGKYGEQIPTDIKDILYRPNKVKKLVDAYWELNIIQQNIKQELKDIDYPRKYVAFYPSKT